MKTNNILLVLLLIITSLQLRAQNNSFCGTEMTPEEEKAYLKRLKTTKKIEQSIFSVNKELETKYIPIKAHIGRTSNGEGGLTTTELNEAIRKMNNDFAPINLEFYLCDGINYIDSDELYDFKKENDNLLEKVYDIPNLINIYFFNTITSGNGNSLCGYAYYPYQGNPNHILMANGCTTNGSTLTHEMGHYYDLRHTHGTSNDILTSELVDGSNCDYTGDYICDTPADPKLSSNNVNENCVYTGNSKDENGDTYKPDPKNIMSYSRKECRTIFTKQQYARMRVASELDTRKYYRCMLSNEIKKTVTTNCDGTSVDFKSVGIGATSWAWDVDSNGTIDYTTQNPTHIFPHGIYNVTLTVSNGKEKITKMYQNFVEHTNETNGHVELELFTGYNSKDISWEFRNDDGTVLYSNPKYTKDDDNNNSPFNYFFDVNSNECYTFEIFDAAGNGLENGSYTLISNYNFLRQNRSNYKFGEKTTFSVGQTPKLKFNNASIDYDKNSCSNEKDVFFFADAEGASSWKWDIDNDGIIDYNTRRFIHNYTTPGNYTVTLSVSDGIETITKTFENAVVFEKADATTSSEYFTFSLVTDKYSAETSWEFKEANGNVLYSKNNYSPYYDNNKLFIYKFKLEGSNCYEFSIYDSFGDGICCSSGAGSYDLRDSDGNIIVKGGDFGSSETFKIYNEQNDIIINPIERKAKTIEKEATTETQPLYIYPNPTQSILHIKGEIATDSYSILDLNGRVLDSGNVMNKTINVQKLSAGVYFLKVSNTTKRFIKE